MCGFMRGRVCKVSNLFLDLLSIFFISSQTKYHIMFVQHSMLYLALTVLSVSSLTLVALWLLFPQIGQLVLQGLQFVYPYIIHTSRSFLSMVVGIILVVYIVEFMRYIVMSAGGKFICYFRGKN